MRKGSRTDMSAEPVAWGMGGSGCVFEKNEETSLMCRKFVICCDVWL